MKHFEVYINFNFERYFSGIIEDYALDGDVENVEEYTKVLAQVREYYKNGVDVETFDQLNEVMSWLSEHLDSCVEYDGDGIVCEG